MYIVENIEGEFITRITICNQDFEELYYIELYQYEFGFFNIEFEEYPDESMVLEKIEDFLDDKAEEFMSFPLNDEDCLSMYDIKTNEIVSYKKLKGLKYHYTYDHTLDLESYDIEEF